MKARGAQPPPPSTPARVVRSFLEDPAVRIVGLLLLVAAAVLLYLRPETGVPPLWRGHPVPADWQLIAPANLFTILLPPDMAAIDDPSATGAYAGTSLRLWVLQGEAATDVRRDRETMSDFRATTFTLDGRRARMGTWRRKDGGPFAHHLGVHIADRSLTLVFDAISEQDLIVAKTAVHTIKFTDT